MKITVSHLSFAYEEKPILEDVSFAFDDTKPLCILGPSGQGKTTILRLIAGLETPKSGSVDGIRPDTSMSILFQEDRLFEHLSVRQNWKVVSSAITEEMVLQMAQKLGLTPDDLKKHPRDLSGGMRRRCALGRSLLFPADMYLMDEPIQGLDENSRLMALEAIRETTKGKPLLVITHNEEDADFLGADIYRLG